MNNVSPVLGILIPCRNEESVLARKLTNLELARWPKSEVPHRLCVVDDGSTDATGERARELCDELFGERADVDAFVVRNDVRPGKSGAIACGLQALEGVELFVLTDADVIVHPGALVALAEAFSDPETGMVSGGQRFVRELAEDGSARGPGGAPLIRAAGLFDRATAFVRAFESSLGRLFSVHGQLLAWRASLGLVPTPGIAADDIDLALSVREKGARVRLAYSALFFEVKTPRSEAGDAQALRRARAYIQVVRKPGATIGSSLADRSQFWFYRVVPLLLPELAYVAPPVLCAVAYLYGGVIVAAQVVALLVILLVTPMGRELLRLVSVIRRARSSEREQSLSDSWEMERS